LPESKDTIESSLEKLCGHGVTIIRITESFHNKEKMDIMNLVLRNLHLAHEKQNLIPLLELKNELELSITPSVIDCFDISNFGTTFAVGSRTRFVNGKPSKEGYRRFKIRTVSGQNDIAMISEIVSRSYSSLSNRDTLPDLIVIDGGRGQLRAALSAIDKLGLEINCISLAKEKEEVYIHPLKKPIRLPKTSGALKVLQHIRDEAHRFGLQYNIKLRAFK
jgi:excinuclease ABC subunit C